MDTSLYMALAAVMLIALSVHVIRGRRHMKVALGDDNQHEMLRRTRAQANFSEYTPLFLLMLAAAEYQGLEPWAVHVFGVLFFAGRVSHAYSLLRAEQYVDGRLAGNPLWRIRGMMMTFTTLGTLALVLVTQRLM